MVRHAAVALACLALAHAIAAPAAFCPKVLEPLDRDSDECPDELKVVARIGPEWDWKKPNWELLKVPGWEVTYRNKPKACKAAADAAGSGARPPGSLVDAHIGRQHKHNNGKKDDKDDDDDRFTTNLEYKRHCFLSDGSFFRDGRCRLKRYRLFKKSLRKRNLWPKMSSQEVAAYVAAAVAAAGAIVRVLRGRRGKKVDDKYP